MYLEDAMVTTRKPKSNTAAGPKGGARKKRETLEEKLDRILKEPVGTPVKLNKREARALLRRVAGNHPHAKPGDQVVKEFYGLWPDSDNDS